MQICQIVTQIFVKFGNGERWGILSAVTTNVLQKITDRSPHLLILFPIFTSFLVISADIDYSLLI